MGTFPIKYTETQQVSPGQAQRVGMPTGSGSNLVGAIDQLSGMFQKIQNAKDVADSSTGRRRADEINYDAYNRYIAEGDEDIRKNIIAQRDRSLKDIGKGLRYSSKVKGDLKSHLDNIMPEWNQTITKGELAIRTRQVEDSFGINIEKMLSIGDVGSAAAEVRKMHQLNPVKYSKAWAQNKIKNLPIDSALMQAKTKAQTDPDAAAADLASIKGTLTDSQSKLKEEITRDISFYEKQLTVQFEDSLNGQLIAIDNTPNMPQSAFDAHAERLKDEILRSTVPNTRKKKLLADLSKWKRGTNEIDYAKILSLNQEMDIAMRTGVVDPTIGNRINRANLEGAFGGRNKGGQKTYADLTRRFGKLKYDERLQAIAPVVREVEQDYLAGDSRLIFLFEQAKNKLIAEHPEWSTRELFIQIRALGEAYEVLPESVIESKLSGKKTIQMTSPKGKSFNVPIEKRQTFIDNGYTE